MKGNKIEKKSRMVYNPYKAPIKIAKTIKTINTMKPTKSPKNVKKDKVDRELNFNFFFKKLHKK